MAEPTKLAPAELPKVIVETPKEVVAPIVTAPLQANMFVAEPRHPEFARACNWDIRTDGNKLVARNNVTSDIFNGTMEEFNKLLKG